MAITLIQPFNLDTTKDYTFANTTATGNTTANNLVASNIVSAAGNVIGANLNTAGNVSVVGNVESNNINASNIISATGNITGANILTSGIISATSNITTANYFIGNGYYLTGIDAGVQDEIANGNSNVSIPAANGNITITSAGNANIVVITGTGANINGYANITGNAEITNVTTGILSATGNITGANLLTGGIVSAAGNLEGNYILGNGAFLTGITSGTQPNIANGNSNVNIPTSNGNILLSVSGNANIITVTGTGANVSGYANISGNVLGGNLQTAGEISATGNITTANYFVGNGFYLTGIAVGVQDKIANANSNVYIPIANGNIAFTVGSNANVIVVTSTGANVNGYANINGNITSAGNISIAGNISGNVFAGNGSGLTNLTGANVTGQVSNALVAGTVYTNAQPNITSVGTLTGLTVGPNSSIILSGNTGYVRANSIQGRDGSQAIFPYYQNVSGAVGIVTDLTVGTSGGGNLIVANGNVAFSGANVSLGDVSNLKIDGGTFNYFLKTDGSGNLSWSAPSISPGGGVNELQFNDTGVFSGTANLTYDSTEYRLSMQNYSLVVQNLGGVSGSTTINLTNGNYVKAIAAGITTWIFTFSAPSGNASGFVLELTNGGTYTMNWPLSVKWPGGAAPELTAIGVDVLVFVTNDNGVTWRGVLSMLNSQ